MAVTLTVSEIRQALLRTGGQPGDGAASSAAIGTLFHQVLGELLRGDSPCNLQAALQDLDADLNEWKSQLKQFTYNRLLGPLLTRQQASLQSQGERVVNLWIALQEACDFLAEVWWEITRQGKQPADQLQWLSAEQQILCEVRQPNWREPVAILGQPDAVLRIPQNNHWCVLEWKLGRCSPDVDLGQACLYHMILRSLKESPRRAALAVINFRPQRSETLFQEEQLLDANGKLLELIGRLANVVPSATNEEAARAVRPNPLPPATNGNGAPSVRPIPPVPPSPPSVIEPPAWIVDVRDKLLKILRQFHAPCKELKSPVVGPTFARFFLFPERGIGSRKVLSQAEQLHLHLGLESPPNIEVIDGAIAIDLPRPDRASIPFSTLVPHLPGDGSRIGCARVPVGMDLNGKWVFCDLAASESAHLLVVGTPGSGKTQWLRVALSALFQTNEPGTLEVVLIDPKQNAFPFAQSSSFLRRPIVVPGDDQNMTEVLEDLIAEMERRYSLFAQARVQSLTDYLQQHDDRLPRIVCLCDEYGDMLLNAEVTESKAARKEIERSLQRLASKGRAAGIHLILATQQPRREIVTPAIKSQIGAKIALRVSSSLESRVALSQDGAERLLGNGDLLYQCIGAPLRLQGAWLPESEEGLVSCGPVSTFNRVGLHQPG